MTNLNESLIKTLMPAKILAVQVGFSRTAVLAETDDGLRCGLTATLSNPEFEHCRQPAVCNAGHLHERKKVCFLLFCEIADSAKQQKTHLR